MKRVILKFIPALICGVVFTNCGSKETNFVVGLNPQEGYGPFTPGYVIIWPSRDSLIYTNVPKDIDEYVVRNFALHTERNVLILIGTKGDKRIIMIDSNNDNDFGNEKILEYDYPLSKEEQKKIENTLPTISTQLEYRENGQVLIKNIKMRPTPYEGSLSLSFNTNSEVEKKYYLFIGIPEHQQGEMKIKGDDFNVFVSNSFTRAVYLKDRVSIFIAPKSQTIDEIKDNIPYKIGDIFNIKNNDYLIDSISAWGDKLFIKYIGKNERPEGISEGYYLPKFDAKYVDNTVFDLAKYSDKYILLDFWGTWCVPCIKLIPELKELNSEFSDKNFALISVAYDDNADKVVDFVVKENMNWSHLFVDRRENDENSVINKLKVTRFPTTILISPDRKIMGRDLTVDELKALLVEKISDK